MARFIGSIISARAGFVNGFRHGNLFFGTLTRERRFFPAEFRQDVQRIGKHALRKADYFCQIKLCILLY